MRPLEGSFVLDFSTLLPGPLATLLLAEAGAEVIKIERPRGEDLRSWEPRWGTDSVHFALLNRGKKSLFLDLKQPGDREQLAPLLARADILVEQFRPGVMARLGLGYDDVARMNPRIVYCSITGYGQHGPKSGVAGHDLNYIADTGLLALSMGSPSHPVIPPALIADIAGGSYPAVINILLALRERDRTGRGRHLDVSMTDNLFTFMYWAIGNGMAADEWPSNGNALLTGGSPRYRLYPTSDGKMLAVGALEQKFWDAICEMANLEAHLRDDSIDPAATASRLAELVASETAETWAIRTAGRDCCCSIVTSLEEAMRDPHFAARGLFRQQIADGRGRVIPALPVPLDPAFRAPS